MDGNGAYHHCVSGVDKCRRISLALVTETFPDDVNGVAMTLGRIAHGFAANGHAISVVRTWDRAANGHDQGALHEWRRPGLPLSGYPEVRFGLPSAMILAAGWRRQPPQVVHVATEGPLGLSALAAARSLGIPVTSSYHTHFDAYTGHYGLGLLEKAVAGYLRRFHNRAACTMVPTVRLATELGSRGFHRTRVLGRGVDTLLFAPGHRDHELRKSWLGGDHGLVLLCVGRLAPEKNLDLAEHCLGRIRSVEPACRLVLVGDGPARARFEHKPGIILAGTRRGADLARHYASADIFVFPSLTESFGNVLLEAMASGLAVLAFDYAAAAEHLASGVNGFAVPFGDADAFAAAALRLAGLAAVQRRALGEQARLHAEANGWNRVVRSFERHLIRAIEGRVAPCICS